MEICTRCPQKNVRLHAELPSCKRTFFSGHPVEWVLLTQTKSTTDNEVGHPFLFRTSTLGTWRPIVFNVLR